MRPRSIFILLLFAVTAFGAVNDQIPADRKVPWVPGVDVGVTGGIAQYQNGGINARGASGGHTTIDITQPPYNADPTGVTDCYAAFVMAAGAATSGDIIFFPEGLYYVAAPHALFGVSNVTIRGAGLNTDRTFKTKIKGDNNIIMFLGAEDSTLSGGGEISKTGGGSLAKGNTQFTVAGGVGSYPVGRLVMLRSDNQEDNAQIEAGATIVKSTVNLPFQRIQTGVITANDGTNITVSPGLFYTPASNIHVYIDYPANQLNKAGLEDIEVYGINSSAKTDLELDQCVDTWVDNCFIHDTDNYNVELFKSHHCEIRRTTIDLRFGQGAGSNGSGLRLGTTGSSLFEDNIIKRQFFLIEVNSGSSGNVFAYNLCEDTRIYSAGTPDPTALASAVNDNHDPHNSNNLYEGNVMTNFQSDGYHGTTSQGTVYRNYIHASVFGDVQHSFIVSLNRFSKDYSMVGNDLGTLNYPFGPTIYSLGNPNLGNSSFIGHAQAYSGDFWADWKMTATLTTRTDDNHGVITLNSGSLSVTDPTVTSTGIFINWDSNADPGPQVFRVYSVVGNVVTIGLSGTLPAQGHALRVEPGYAGYQEKDDAVFLVPDGGFTIAKANVVMFAAGGPAVPASESIGTDTLPDSEFRATKPAYFGSLAWPPFGPQNTAPAYTDIPAGVRFLLNDPPVLQSISLGSDGRTFTMSFSKPVVFGAGGNGGWTTSFVGVGLTYSSGSGTTSLQYTSTRANAILDIEAGTVNYVQPGNGVEDTNGNDLASVSSVTVYNFSTQTGNSHWLEGISLGGSDTNQTYAGGGFTYIQPIVMDASGLVTNARIYIVSRIADYASHVIVTDNATGAYLTSATATVNQSGNYIIYTLNPSISVTNGTTYRLAWQINSNSDPVFRALAGQASGSSVGSTFYTYSQFAANPNPVASSYSDTKKYVVGLLLTPDSVETPVYSPIASTYSTAQSVTISCGTSGATIYYTIDGSTPTTGSTVYSAPVSISVTTTLKALAVKAGLSDSPIASGLYTISSQTATPTYSPAAGTYSSTQSVTISSTTAGAAIYYTTDGSTPTTGSTVYSTPVSIASTTTLKALATHAGLTNSTIASGVYTITAGTPNTFIIEGTFRINGTIRFP